MSSDSGVLYVDVTNNLVVRVAQHKQKLIPSSAPKYNVTKLTTQQREIGHSKRETEQRLGRMKTVKLIKKRNPKWDLAKGRPPATISCIKTTRSFRTASSE